MMILGELVVVLPKSLLEGHRRFLRDRQAPEKGRYLQLAELGQTPAAMVIACCDSRLDVSAIFDAEPGGPLVGRPDCVIRVRRPDQGV